MKHKIIITKDIELLNKDAISSFSKEDNFAVHISNSLDDALEEIKDIEPTVILTRIAGNDEDLIFEKINKLKNSINFKPLIIMASNNGSRDEYIKAMENGADIFIADPITPKKLLEKLDIVIHQNEINTAFENDNKNLLRILSISNLINSTFENKTILDQIVSHLSKAIPSERCSLIILSKDHASGYVISSSDKRMIDNLEIGLNKYPEMRASIMSKSAVFISDISSDPLMEPVKQYVKFFKGLSALVMPIMFNDEVLGIIVLRARREGRGFSESEINFCTIVSNLSYQAIKNAELNDTILKEKNILNELSVIDVTTSLYNRDFFNVSLKKEFERATRYDLNLSIIIGDIDNFKFLNDNYGNITGDRVLREIGARLKKLTRTTDLVARYGGVKFAIIMPHTDKEGALTEAERLREIVDSHSFAHIIKDDITISIGVSSFPGPGILSQDHLIEKADKALHDAKNSGKNKVCFL